MNLNRIDKVERYLEITQDYKRKGCYSNDFIQKEVPNLINEGKLFECCTDDNAFLFVKKDVGLRLYYYLNNLESVSDFDIKDDLICELLFRGDNYFPQKEIDYLSKCGFVKHILRDQYFASYKDINLFEYEVPGLSIYIAESLDEIKYAVDLFNKTFDNYTGNFIPFNECNKLLSDKCILIARLDGRLAGAMHFRREGKLIWAEHNVVEPWCRGKHVGSLLCNAFIETSKVDENTRYYRWTQHSGLAAKMYEKLGFRYINKSSYSMLKLYNKEV